MLVAPAAGGAAIELQAGEPVAAHLPRVGIARRDRVAAFRAELDRGYLAMVTTGPGQAEQVRELPVDADLVILRLPISGG